jgi:hypothetical protein
VIAVKQERQQIEKIPLTRRLIFLNALQLKPMQVLEAPNDGGQTLPIDFLAGSAEPYRSQSGRCHDNFGPYGSE